MFCKSFNGSGSRVVKEFMSDFHKQFMRRVKIYATCWDDINEADHIFYYGEQQVKGHVSATLDSICRSHFIQEPKIERKAGNGRADYWCRYGSNTKIDVMMEVKHGWARCKDKDNMTIYSHTINKHKSAIDQLGSTNMKDYVYGNKLFTMALTVMPLYCDYETKPDSTVSLSVKNMDNLASFALKKCGAHCVTAWAMPKALNLIDSFDRKGKTAYQSYPGLILLWSVRKIHRDR